MVFPSPCCILQRCISPRLPSLPVGTLLACSADVSEEPYTRFDWFSIQSCNSRAGQNPCNINHLTRLERVARRLLFLLGMNAADHKAELRYQLAERDHEITFLKQAITARRIVQQLSPAPTTTNPYNAVPLHTPPDNGQRNERLIPIASLHASFDDKRTTKGRYSREGRLIQLGWEIKRLRWSIYIGQRNQAMIERTCRLEHWKVLTQQTEPTDVMGKLGSQTKSGIAHAENVNLTPTPWQAERSSAESADNLTKKGGEHNEK